MEAIREEEYVTLQVHDAQFGRIEELIEHSLARQEAIASKINGEIVSLNAKVDGLEKKMDARFEHLEDMIAMTNSRIDDLNNKKSNNIALWAIAAAVGICAFQAIVSLISLLK